MDTRSHLAHGKIQPIDAHTDGGRSFHGVYCQGASVVIRLCCFLFSIFGGVTSVVKRPIKVFFGLKGTSRQLYDVPCELGFRKLRNSHMKCMHREYCEPPMYKIDDG